jgi:hypothetical protein
MYEAHTSWDNAVREIVAASKRYRWLSTLRRRASQSGMAFDRQRPEKLVKLELILYTRDGSDTCRRALSTIHRVLEQYNKAQVSLTVCDLAKQPDGGDDDSVIYTPTLVKRGPGPRTWIVGNLDRDEFLIELLEVSGIDRRSR